MYRQLYNDKENIDSLIYNFYLFSKNILKDFDKRSVGVVQPTHTVDKLQKNGLGFTKAFELFADKYESYLSGSAGSRYFGFVTGGSTPAALIGDWITSLYDQNVASLGESSSGDITLETIDQLKTLFELDARFEGIFVSGATMSNFVGLATAREWFGKHFNVNISIDGLQKLNEPLYIYSASAHSSIYKSLSMLGLGKSSLKCVATNENRESIDLEDLESKLKQQNGIPCIVVANAGTINIVDFDDIRAIAVLKEKYDFWLHVDAAFGGFAKCSMKYKHLIAGLECADSITIDAHKWLNIPYDSAMHFTKHLDLQFEVFKNASPYLQPGFSNKNFVHLTPENSQRFRALPVWFTLNAYGQDGYAEIVERNCALAKELAGYIESSDKFTLLNDVILNGICFTLKREDLDMPTINRYISLLNAGGEIFITPSVYKEIPALRISISNWQTEKKDIDLAWKALQKAWDQL